MRLPPKRVRDRFKDKQIIIAWAEPAAGALVSMIGRESLGASQWLTRSGPPSASGHSTLQWQRHAVGLGSRCELEVQMPGLECVVPPVASVGCKDTLDIQEEEKIDVEYVVGYGWTSEMLEDWYPTPAVVIGLAYLAAKGRPFEG